MTMGGPKTTLPLDEFGNVNAAGMSTLRAGRTNIGPSNIMGMSSTGNPLLKDLHMAHEFVKSVGEEHYGKSYLVKAPNICYYSDSGLSDASLFRSSKPKYIWSDVPSSDGGYPATTDSEGTGTGFYTLLDLPYPSTGADYFSDDTGKVQGITLFPNPSGSGNNSVKGDFVIYESGVYGKLSAEGEPELFKVGQGPFEYDSTTGALTGDAFNYFDGTIYYFNVGTGITPVAVVKIDPLETGEPSIIPAAGALGTRSATPASRTVPPGPTSVRGDIWGTTLKNAMAKASKRFQPSGVIVPMLSNTTRYGPWGFVGPAGPVKFENDDDLAPWNFGGYAPLWSGAIEEVRAALTFMQVGERGSFTVGGYPTKSLGQDLKSQFSGMYSLTLQSINDPEFGAFKYVATTPMDGSFGPNITNISTSIGDGGATTTYQLSTFTPSFGRMSKMNANRLKTVGANKARHRKQLRENLKIKQMLNKIGVVGGGVASHGIDGKATNTTPMAQRARPADLIVGAHNKQLTNTENPDADMGGLDMIETASSDSISQSSFAAMDSGTYQQTAFASQDIFARPVSRFGDGNFPQYATPTNLVCGSGSIPPQPQGPFLEWEAPTIDIVYYDPFPSTGDSKHVRAADGGGSLLQDHHDISVMAFGAGTGEHRNEDTFDLLEHEFENGEFPDDYRFMATRGPLLIHGWGYDTNGKPIPNHADNEANARAGIFTGDNLTDYFPSGWLRKAGTWPVAPLDLRFDRDRGVWTVPGPPKMLTVKANFGAITAGNTGACTVLDSISVSDGDGSSVPNPTVAVKADSAVGGSIDHNETFYVFYDDVECVWLPLMPGNSTSIGGGSLCFYDKAYCFSKVYDDDSPEPDPVRDPCIDYDNPLTNFEDGGCLESNICIDQFTDNIIIGTGLKAYNCEWSLAYDCCGLPTSGTQIDLYLPVANSQKIPNLDPLDDYKYVIYKGNAGANDYCIDEYTAVDYGYGLVVENLNLVNGVGCPDHDNDAENILRCPTYRVALDQDYETQYASDNTCTNTAAFSMRPRGTQPIPLPATQVGAPEKESWVHYGVGLFAEDNGDTIKLHTDHRLYSPVTDPLVG